MQEDVECLRSQIRAELIRKCRNKRTRVAEFSRSAPIVWQPCQVINPRTDIPFTDAGAWHFIADCLEAGHPMEEITMDHPPNSVGFVLKIDLEPVGHRLYVKLQLGRGMVIGRSFHYSTR